MKQKSDFFTQLNAKYRVIVRSDENFAEKTNLSLSLGRGIMLGIAVLSTLFILFYFLSKAIIVRTYQADNMELETQLKLLQLSEVVDSLALELQARDEYVLNIKKIAEGGQQLIKDSEQKRKEKFVHVKEANLEESNKMDKVLREEFESSKPEPTVALNTEVSTLNNVFLFTPIIGIISSEFDSKINHFGIDIVSKKNEPVKAVADGTVIISSWTEDTGYIIALQHENNVISIYKHNSTLLKKVGNFVRGGEIISIIGNTGELTTGPHLHFELWHNGNPVNPKNYIAF